MTYTPQTAARIALQCLDLTSLGDTDNEADVVALCQRAVGPHGPVAAVCVWPRFVALARGLLPTHVAVAAVANFPHGSSDVDQTVREAEAIVQDGAQEVDVVMPYHALLAGRELMVARLIKAVRLACPNQTLKVILETGELTGSDAVRQAAQVAIDNGANFIKTSTGKTQRSASLEAVQTMLQVINAQPPQLSEQLGIKPSGGIRTVAQALPYLQATATALGADALNPLRFRIGASSLLDDIEAVLGGGKTNGVDTIAY